MVQEFRRIVLSTEEVEDALEIYRRIAPAFLPEGKIARCNVTEYGVVKLMLETKREGGQPHQTYHTLQALDILKPIVGFCIEHQIPLPKSGRKLIEMQRGCVVLRVELTIEVNIKTSSSTPAEPVVLGPEETVKPTESAAAG